MHIKTKRQHPITVFHYLYRQIRHVVIPIALIVFSEIRGGTGNKPYWVYGIAAIYSVAIIIWSCLSWYKSVYYVEDGVLHTRTGITNVQHRTIPIVKINNFDTEQNFINRLLGVFTVSLQTADSDLSADAKFSVSRRDMTELVNLLTSLNAKEDRAQASKVQIGSKELFMMSISSNTLFLGLPVAAPVLQYIFKWIGLDEDNKTVSEFMKDNENTDIMSPEYITATIITIAAVFACLLIISAIISMVVVHIRYHNWTVHREEDVLVIHYGLFSKRVARLSVPKIQAIRVKEKPLSKHFGYVSVYVDSIGYTGSRKMLIPSIKKSEMKQIVETLCPEFDLTTNFQKCDPRGKIYFSAKPYVKPVAVVLLASLFVPYALLALIPLAALYLVTQMRYKQSGWSIHGNQLIVHSVGVVTTTVYVLRKAIQSIYFKEEWAMEKHGLKALEADIDSPASGREYVIEGLSVEHVDQIKAWYKNK